MKTKYLLIGIIIAIIIIGGLYFYMNNMNKIYAENVVITEIGNGTYEIDYTVNVNKEYNVLDCGCSLVDENKSFLGYGENILTNVKPGKINLKCNASLDENFVNNTTTTQPNKILIHIYDEKFNSNLKDKNGNFQQIPIYSETVSVYL